MLELVTALQVATWVFRVDANLELSWRLIFAIGLVTIAAFLCCLFPALRAAGRLRMAWVAAGIAAFGLAIGILSLNLLDVPRETMFDLPRAVTIGILIAMNVLWRLVPVEVTDRWLAVISRGGMDDQAWLRRLDALLRGRHGVPISSAKSLVTQAHEHLNATGGHAERELGPVEAYARSLAEATPASRRRVRRTIAMNTVCAVVALYFAVDATTGPDFNLLLCCVFGSFLVFLVFYSIVLWTWE